MNLSLPDYYIDWLKSVAGCYSVEHSERSWFISNIEDLQEEVNIDGNVTPAWQQLKSFAKMFAEVTEQEATDDEDGNEFLLSRLSNCIVIGEENGDPLFFDPSDQNSVWCYYQDGGDVAKLSPSLKSFVSEAVIEEE